MAIRTKAEMLAGITSMFADNDEGDITAAIARSEFNDWIDSLLVPGGIVGGAGISVSDNGDGSATVSAAGAAAAVGIPSYVAAGAAQPSDAVVTANIAGVTDSPPFPSLVYLLTPNDIDRAADDLELRINGDTSRVRSLVDFRGDPLNARDLDPGALYEILAHASPTQQYRLTEPIPQRRQDWKLAMVYQVRTNGGSDPELEDAWIANATESDTPSIVVPAEPAGATESSGYLWLGVPVDAPVIAVIDRVDAGNISFEAYPPTGLTLNVPDYDGVPYRWVRTRSRYPYSLTPGAVFRVTYGDYA